MLVFYNRTLFIHLIFVFKIFPIFKIKVFSISESINMIIHTIKNKIRLNITFMSWSMIEKCAFISYNIRQDYIFKVIVMKIISLISK